MQEFFCVKTILCEAKANKSHDIISNVSTQPPPISQQLQWHTELIFVYKSMLTRKGSMSFVDSFDIITF